MWLARVDGSEIAALMTGGAALGGFAWTLWKARRKNGHAAAALAGALTLVNELQEDNANQRRQIRELWEENARLHRAVSFIPEMEEELERLRKKGRRGSSSRS